MKNKISIFSAAVSAAILCAALSSCGNGGGIFAEPTPTPIPSADASAVISLEDAQNAVGSSYELKVAEEEAEEADNVSVVTYVSSEIGKGDPVRVKVINPTSSVTPDDIWADYENSRISRSSSKLVDNIGEDAYIAYPFIHVYDRGCEIVITAGSDADDDQKALLEKLAALAAERIEAIMPEVD